ncbi:HAD family hydrolase [Salsuginibacillus kocurii]|uniref:HAD family hydrolase n=1 Tax=Salsuginibacillus kocurii TaxID=427078 RepID=UPI000364A892|nr:HAD-IA family hydrolase [Salsuginibacillus kocurii]
MKHYAGWMFDMDQTLIASAINFDDMRQACIQELHLANVVLPEEVGEKPPPAQLIEAGRKYEKQYGNNGLVERMYACVAACEMEGMKEAEAEAGAKELVSYLSKEAELVVVTNNATESAITALRNNGLLSYFQAVYGRDRLQALKPSPDSVKKVLHDYPMISAKDWVMIGDSWIDGKAANLAGVDFISYHAANLTENEIIPVLETESLHDLYQYLREVKQ